LSPKSVFPSQKTVYFTFPSLDFFWWLSNQIFINRRHRASAIGTLDVVAERIKGHKHSVWIFPEGTRNLSSDKEPLLPFKKGAFHMGIESGAPILPIIMAPVSSVAELSKGRIYGGEYHIRVLPPISTSNLSKVDVDTLLERVRAEMLNAYKDLSINAGKEKKQ